MGRFAARVPTAHNNYFIRRMHLENLKKCFTWKLFRKMLEKVKTLKEP